MSKQESAATRRAQAEPLLWSQVDQAVAASKQLVFVARCSDDSARWGEQYVKIRAKHLAALVALAKVHGIE